MTAYTDDGPVDVRLFQQNLGRATSHRIIIGSGARERRPHVDDKLKEQLLPAVMVFNFILAIYMSVRIVYPMLMSNRPLRSGTFFTHLLIGAAIAIVPAAIIFFIMLRRK